jgi:hypothetical protein
MIRDIVVWVSEALFWATGGVPLVYTFWFIPWIVLGLVIMMSPIIVLIYGKGDRKTILAAFILTLLFFPTFFITMIPSMGQKQMMTQCETVTLNVSSDRVESTTIEAIECRTKNNFYDDFGEWVVK